MADSILRDKSKAFAKDIVFLCRKLKQNNDEGASTNQLLRSGASVGANVHEAPQEGACPSTDTQKPESLCDEGPRVYFFMRTHQKQAEKRTPHFHATVARLFRPISCFVGVSLVE